MGFSCGNREKLSVSTRDKLGFVNDVEGFVWFSEALRLVKLCGKREVPHQWSGKANKWEVEVYANTLIQLGRALGVNVEAELHRWRQEHQRDSNIKRWTLTFIKAKTPHAPATWCDLVFGEADPAKVAMAQSWTNGSMSYHNLQGDQVNWCRHSRVAGMLPSQILAAIRGANMNLVPAVYVDPGLKNFLAGVWQYLDAAVVTFQPFRVTGAYYHHRVGLNRVRQASERRPSQLGLSWEQRASLSKAKHRRLVEEGKRQLFHEVLASWRLFSDRHADGRDFGCHL